MTAAEENRANRVERLHRQAMDGVHRLLASSEPRFTGPLWPAAVGALRPDGEPELRVEIGAMTRLRAFGEFRIIPLRETLWQLQGNLRAAAAEIEDAHASLILKSRPAAGTSLDALLGAGEVDRICDAVGRTDGAAKPGRILAFWDDGRLEILKEPESGHGRAALLGRSAFRRMHNAMAKGGHCLVPGVVRALLLEHEARLAAKEAWRRAALLSALESEKSRIDAELAAGGRMRSAKIRRKIAWRDRLTSLQSIAFAAVGEVPVGADD